jgi:acyl-CoA synthetase (AMP-forming)/AMP-acid ligase II
MAHLDVRIVDSEGEELPADGHGELLVRGAGILRGYWNQPDASATTLADGWLRTGDLFSIDNEGYLTLHGRLKELIKTGGENVYPREVEAALFAHADVIDCAVFGVPDPYWTEAVKATVVMRAGSTTVPADLVAWCREQIAGYKRPRYIEILDRLPRSDAGKLLMRELRERPTTPDQAID